MLVFVLLSGSNVHILYSFFLLLLPSPSLLGRYLTSIISASFSDTGYSHLFTATEFVHQHSIPAFTRKGRFPCRFVVFSVFLFPLSCCCFLLPFCSLLSALFFCHLVCSLFPLPSPAISFTLSCYFLCPPLLFPSTLSYYFLCPPLLFLPPRDTSSALSFTLFCSFLNFSHYFSAAICLLWLFPLPSPFPVLSSAFSY